MAGGRFALYGMWSRHEKMNPAKGLTGPADACGHVNDVKDNCPGDHKWDSRERLPPENDTLAVNLLRAGFSSTSVYLSGLPQFLFAPNDPSQLPLSKTP